MTNDGYAIDRLEPMINDQPHGVWLVIYYKTGTFWVVFPSI